MKVAPAPQSSQIHNLSEAEDDQQMSIIYLPANELAAEQGQGSEPSANDEIENEMNMKIEMAEKRKEEIKRTRTGSSRVQRFDN